MTDKPVTANHYIGFAFGWLFTALIFSQLGIREGRRMEREDISMDVYKADSLYRLDSAAWLRHLQIEVERNK